MKRAILTIVMLCLTSAAYAGGGPSIDPNVPFLATDGREAPIQDFVPDPTKSQTNASMTGTITFGKTGSPTVNISGWMAISVVPTADATYYYNSDTGKTFPLYSGQANLIWVKQSGVTSVTLTLGSATASVQGM